MHMLGRLTFCGVFFFIWKKATYLNRFGISGKLIIAQNQPLIGCQVTEGRNNLKSGYRGRKNASCVEFEEVGQKDGEIYHEMSNGLLLRSKWSILIQW